jgi:hypothetical protein
MLARLGAGSAVIGLVPAALRGAGYAGGSTESAGTPEQRATAGQEAHAEHADVHAVSTSPDASSHAHVVETGVGAPFASDKARLTSLYASGHRFVVFRLRGHGASRWEPARASP